MSGINFPLGLINRQCIDPSASDSRIYNIASTNNAAAVRSFCSGGVASDFKERFVTDTNMEFKSVAELEKYATQFGTDADYLITDCAPGTGTATVNNCYFEYSDAAETYLSYFGTPSPTESGSTTEEILERNRIRCTQGLPGHNNKGECIYNKTLNLCDGISTTKKTMDKVCYWRFGMYEDCYYYFENVFNWVDITTENSDHLLDKDSADLGTAFEIELYLS